jgi:hypothetical protein
MMGASEIVGIIVGVLFFAFVVWLAFKKPPFDDFYDGGIHP